VKREAVKREKNHESVKREECSRRSESLRIIKNSATVKFGATKNNAYRIPIEQQSSRAAEQQEIP